VYDIVTVKNRIPVYVLTGFLGSGKTTVLRNMLTYCKENKLQAGVILNELGESNVEGHLFSDSKMVELLNGCICCTIQEDLRSTLNEFIQTQNTSHIDILIIEGTGVANPLEIIEALMEYQYKDAFDLSSIIGMVDASQYIEYQSIFSSTKEVRTMLENQIIYSNILLLNKMDLITSKRLERIENKLSKLITDKSNIIKTTFATVDVPTLLQKRFSIINKDIQKQCEHIHSESCGCTNKYVENHATINAVKLSVDSPISRVSLVKWLKSLPNDIFRGKGIIQLKEASGYFEFQYASKKVTINSISKVQNIEPGIVIIGKCLNEEELLQSFKVSCL
jgi:G3E family GTPase